MVEAVPIGDVEDMAVAYQAMEAVVEQHRQTVEKASPRSPRSPKSVILEEPKTPPELGDKKDKGGESVDPAYLSVKGRIDLFQNRATVSPRSTASGSGLRPTGMTPRSAPEAESTVIAPASPPGLAIPPTEGNVFDTTGQRPILIGTPAIGTPADRSRSVTPHTQAHHPLARRARTVTARKIGS